jgi:AbrB family looped-hinge helix DNA binding protein
MPKHATVTTRLTRNYQVSIPKRIRDELALELGTFFEVRSERGGVFLQPKVLPNIHPADLKRAHEAYDEAKADAKAGRLSPAFETAAEGLAHLHRLVRPRKPRRNCPQPA